MEPIEIDVVPRALGADPAAHLIDEERIAGGSVVHFCHESLGRRASADDLHERPDLRLIEPGERQPFAVAHYGADPRRNLRAVYEIEVTICENQKDIQLRDVTREVLQKRQRGIISPMQIVQHDDQRTGPCRIPQERAQAIE